MANIFTSSIGKKLIMSISGLFLIIFLLLHMTINFFSVIDSFTGKYGAADGLFQAGCDFMALPIVTVMVPVLAFGFVIHIIYAAYLTWCNIQSRGGYKRYEVASKAKIISLKERKSEVKSHGQHNLKAASNQIFGRRFFYVFNTVSSKLSFPLPYFPVKRSPCNIAQLRRFFSGNLLSYPPIVNMPEIFRHRL